MRHRVAGTASTDEVINFTFGDDFNPDMRVVDAKDGVVIWYCVGGHQPWADNVSGSSSSTPRR